ncbi:CCE_0567 family metalloprotein [Gluconobacter kondonii]|nr:CCE_0567 family metalloprotein [Gluconobacter kondonii]
MPVGWSSIPEVAARAHDAYALLETRRAALRALEEKEV